MKFCFYSPLKRFVLVERPLKDEILFNLESKVTFDFIFPLQWEGA